jgi:regulator of sigma E protease
MLSWLAPVLVFGLVVLVHELGHFIAAKWLGVYAPRFSIGFGPALWRRRFGETEYILAALPLGGFVRMASREDEATAFLEGGSEQQKVPAVGASSSPTITGEHHAVEAKPKDWDPNAMIPFGPKPVPEDRWFESKPLWGRLIIMLAGVTMNAVLALVVSTGLFMGYGRAYIPAVWTVWRLPRSSGAPAWRRHRRRRRQAGASLDRGDSARQRVGREGDHARHHPGWATGDDPCDARADA